MKLISEIHILFHNQVEVFDPDDASMLLKDRLLRLFDADSGNKIVTLFILLAVGAKKEFHVDLILVNWKCRVCVKVLTLDQD